MLYITNITYLNMTKTVSKLLEFLRNPLLIYNAAVTRAITYLYQIKTFIIKYLKENIINHIFVRASDTSFKDNLVSRKSIEGYLFTLFKGLIN